MAEIFWPYNPSIINYGFGYAPGYGGFHNGIDFPVAQGTEIRATAAGKVRNNDAGQRDGAGVDITTADGWTARHWHVSRFLVGNGVQVNAGDVIALSGGQPGTWGAGNASGPHLHWGVANGRVNNDYNWINPAEQNPQFFGSPKPQPQPLPEGLQMAKIYINSENGQNVLMNPETGFEWIIPTPAYKDLVKAMGLVEQEISATPDQINFLRQIAKK